ncbi:hypothetical protein A2160_05725 [Candidatus Beckwithbacteria bacterium RBG_13_42_9]|uniref:Nucleoside 2-deoxyribosyltransferase n=1 Tax=Candidatus Beckwithbacteria bacterium RBG_13_42_9 TaxID=1797457 RepID=A0A1F5E6C3_9BACT|nr:MAG: hypothetical protein A2160_05725 [Candidatus Beckwithbacteria bacterium RBG_13_42_9]
MGYQHTSTCLVEDTPEKFYGFTKEQRAKHYERVFSEISEADLIIVEATLPSLTIGQFIQEGLDQKIPVLVLCREGERPSFLDGVEEKEDGLLIMEYEPQNLPPVIKEGVNFLCDSLSGRFTMILPKNILRYLNRIAKTGISRSEYIRKLILKDMRGRQK